VARMLAAPPLRLTMAMTGMSAQTLGSSLNCNIFVAAPRGSADAGGHGAGLNAPGSRCPWRLDQGVPPGENAAPCALRERRNPNQRQPASPPPPERPAAPPTPSPLMHCTAPCTCWCAPSAAPRPKSAPCAPT
jgi:hypothetical protein